MDNQCNLRSRRGRKRESPNVQLRHLEIIRGACYAGTGDAGLNVLEDFVEGFNQAAVAGEDKELGALIKRGGVLRRGGGIIAWA